jgi:CubicO group peptidase (beta-lactamase class C family)
MLRRPGATWGTIGTLALALVLGATATFAEPSNNCSAVSDIGDGWDITAPAQVGFNQDSICTLSSSLAALQGANPHGIVVVRHGKLVYENYFAGGDQRWPQQHWNEPLVETPHDVRTKHDMQSITKSVTALLVGIALDRGELKALDTPVLSFFSAYDDLRTPEKLRITVRDLLTMSTGLSWPYKPYLRTARQMDAAPDPYRFVLEQRMVSAPGEKFHYNNGSAELAGAVVQKATGLALDQFAKRALFDPLTIEDWEWGKMASGDPGASWGLRLRPRDLAKIGQLVLNRGTWRGRRVVSSEWIETMIAPHIVRPKTTYGYLWWLDRRTVDGRDIDLVSAIGWGGQYLHIVPQLDLVVVVTAGVYDFNGDGHPETAGNAALDTVLRATEH